MRAEERAGFEAVIDLIIRVLAAHPGAHVYHYAPGTSSFAWWTFAPPGVMYGVERDDVVAKEAWRRLLQQYCELDTMSMVLIFEYWRRATAASGARPALY